MDILLNSNNLNLNLNLGIVLTLAYLVVLKLQPPLQDILEAQDDWRASQQRQAKLHAALKDNNKPPRETLKAILLEFPDICQDPV
jgi:hypothetical protein